MPLSSHSLAVNSSKNWYASSTNNVLFKGRKITSKDFICFLTKASLMTPTQSVQKIMKALNVGDITQSNNGRIRLTQKTNIKEITWRHYIVFFRQYLPPTLLLLKDYCKFVPMIQPRCWVLQIAILENDHRVFCVSFQVNTSLYLYP